MAHRNGDIQPPALGFLMLEGRAWLELSMFIAAQPLLRRAPRGDGHPVLVLPGFLASDSSTLAMRRFLRRQGYDAHGWGLGRNVGPVESVLRGIPRRVRELRQRRGRKVTLIGWSLGGIYAREIARDWPDNVRQVITLASPFRAPTVSNVWFPAKQAASVRRKDAPWRSRMGTPLAVPTTAIYSRSDGIVAWQSCLEEPGVHRENIEVSSSHCGMGHHPTALRIIADRLAQPEGNWAPYDASN